MVPILLPTGRGGQNKGHKTSKLDENRQPLATNCPGVDEDSISEKVDMAAVFAQDLAAVRARLNAEEVASSDVKGREEAAVQPAVGVGGVETARPAAFGHRAGFDAFMTGYAFGCYALESCGDGERVESGAELVGLEDMRNKLASRRGNWKVPLCILKSHFASTSSTHSVARERMKELLCHTACGVVPEGGPEGGALSG